MKSDLELQSDVEQELRWEPAVRSERIGVSVAGGVVELDGHVDSRFTIDAEHLDAVVGRLHAARIHTLTATPPSLDALFLRTYDGQAVPLDATGLGESQGARR